MLPRGTGLATGVSTQLMGPTDIFGRVVAYLGLAIASERVHNFMIHRGTQSLP
jgi:hypothetical protein